MTESIYESGMEFGTYPDGHCFHIEKSQTYQKIRDNVKIAEFLLYRPSSVVWIIEAKSSSPRPETQPGFDEFIAEIREKFSNTLVLCIAIQLKRHSTWNECPEIFQNMDIQKTDFRFVLVINGHRQEWLPPLQDALTKALKTIVKVWNLSPLSVVVLNHLMAEEQGLIRKTQSI